jgi:hypothetical protein
MANARTEKDDKLKEVNIEVAERHRKQTIFRPTFNQLKVSPRTPLSISFGFFERMRSVIQCPVRTIFLSSPRAKFRDLDSLNDTNNPGNQRTQRNPASHKRLCSSQRPPLRVHQRARTTPGQRPPPFLPTFIHRAFFRRPYAQTQGQRIHSSNSSSAKKPRTPPFPLGKRSPLSPSR